MSDRFNKMIRIEITPFHVDGFYWRMVEILLRLFWWTWNNFNGIAIEMLSIWSKSFKNFLRRMFKGFPSSITGLVIQFSRAGRGFRSTVKQQNCSKSCNKIFLMLQNLKQINRLLKGCWKWAMRSAINAAHSIVDTHHDPCVQFRSCIKLWRFVTACNLQGRCYDEGPVVQTSFEDFV